MGGAGSGNFGHSGRPGEVGGSSSDGGGGTFDRARWEKMPMSERRSEWERMSIASRDKMADARNSVKTRVGKLVSTLGKWENTGDLEKDVKTRIDSAKNDMSKSSHEMVVYNAAVYGDALREAGVSEDARGKLLCTATDYMLAQEMEAQNRQLGDHGIHHITGDIDRAFQIAAVTPYKETPLQRAEVLTAMVFHDAGYLTEPSRAFLDEGHARWSQQNYDENLYSLVRESLGKDAANDISYYIRTHDSTDINWKEDPVGSGIRVADNTALFADDKLPGVFRDVPGTFDTLRDLKAGTISLDIAKQNMLADVNNSNLSPAMKERYRNAVNEVTPYTPTATLGMKGGDIYDISYENDHVVITLEYNEDKTEQQKLLDLGQAQFGKLAKTYGVDPKEFTDTLNFEFEKNGQVLLEGRIKDPEKPLVAVYSGPVDNRQVT